ncbi:MAG: formate--tetrahydrofolate ligase, partial [Flavobacteriales bacterium]|nr:formate--tetrahydrofolate ligase [Flavobacteriales bacterium]
EGWEHGGEGTLELAKVVAEVVDKQTEKIKPLYNWDSTVKGKILEISEKTYGAKDVKFLPAANKKIKQIEALGLDKLPICMAKTQKSFSDDDKKLGRPEDFIITVRDIEIAAGAGFVIPITGKMMRMPGLPAIPAAEGMDIDNEGNISGLS